VDSANINLEATKMSTEIYDVATTVVLEGPGASQKLKLRFNFIEEPRVVAQRFVDEYSLPAYAKLYVLEYLKQYKMCVIKRQIPKKETPTPKSDDSKGKDQFQGKMYDVVTSIEKVKSGLGSYLNPWSYVNPMEQMKLHFNYTDSSEEVARAFADKHKLSEEDFMRIIDWIDSIKAKHEEQLSAKNRLNSGSALQAPPSQVASVKMSLPVESLEAAASEKLEPDIVTTITKPGKPGLFLAFHSSGDPIAAAKEFVTRHELSSEDEVKIVGFLLSKQAAIRRHGSAHDVPASTMQPLESLTREQVLQWIHAMQLDCFRSIFLEIGVDGSIVADMEIDDLLELKVCTRIECKKLLKSIHVAKSKGIDLSFLVAPDTSSKGDTKQEVVPTMDGSAVKSGDAPAATSEPQTERAATEPTTVVKNESSQGNVTVTAGVEPAADAEVVAATDVVAATGVAAATDVVVAAAEQAPPAES